MWHRNANMGLWCFNAVMSLMGGTKTDSQPIMSGYHTEQRGLTTKIPDDCHSRNPAHRTAGAPTGNGCIKASRC